jgi:hypothetical protein
MPRKKVEQVARSHQYFRLFNGFAGRRDQVIG